MSSLGDVTPLEEELGGALEHVDEAEFVKEFAKEFPHLLDPSNMSSFFQSEDDKYNIPSTSNNNNIIIDECKIKRESLDMEEDEEYVPLPVAEHTISSSDGNGEAEADDDYDGGASSSKEASDVENESTVNDDNDVVVVVASSSSVPVEKTTAATTTTISTKRKEIDRTPFSMLRVFLLKRFDFAREIDALRVPHCEGLEREKIYSDGFVQCTFAASNCFSTGRRPSTLPSRLKNRRKTAPPPATTARTITNTITSRVYANDSKRLTRTS